MNLLKESHFGIPMQSLRVLLHSGKDSKHAMATCRGHKEENSSLRLAFGVFNLSVFVPWWQNYLRLSA